jgi:hypothetical protein
MIIASLGTATKHIPFSRIYFPVPTATLILEMPSSTYCAEGKNSDKELSQSLQIAHREYMCIACSSRTKEQFDIHNNISLFRNQHAEVKNVRCLKRKVGYKRIYCKDDVEKLKQNCKPCFLEYYRIQYHHYSRFNDSDATMQNPPPERYVNPMTPVNEFPIVWPRSQGEHPSHFSADLLL